VETVVAYRPAPDTHGKPLVLDDEAMVMVLGCAIEVVRAEPPRELKIKTREDGLGNLVPERSSVPWQPTRIAIDATKLEANAAMRSIVRRDRGES
jgi:hypothetical protein